jgi:hypothetical protein
MAPFIALLVLSAFLGPGGCSLIPSPLIVGDTYTNFEYEYSLDLPEGWEPAPDPSEALERCARWVDEGMVSLVLTHPASDGLIAVFNGKQELAYPRYMGLAERYWADRIDTMHEHLKAEVDVQRYDYWIYKDNLVATQQNYFVSQRAYRPEKVFGVDARIIEGNVAKRLIFEWFLFPCQKDRSCQTIIMMICREDLYKENRPAFDAVVATLRAHDYYN